MNFNINKMGAVANLKGALTTEFDAQRDANKEQVDMINRVETIVQSQLMTMDGGASVGVAVNTTFGPAFVPTPPGSFMPGSMQNFSISINVQSLVNFVG